MKTFFKKHPEIATVAVAMLVFFLSPYLMRWVDPTAGAFDAGIFQIPMFAVVVLFVFVAVAWFLLGNVFSTFRRYLVTELKTDFKTLTSWQKIKVSYAIFFALLFALVWLSQVLVASR